MPLSQSGITRAVSLAELLSGTQQAIEVPSPCVLGRASLGPGGPESLTVGLVVLQTGYCEGIYINAPVVVGVDYLVSQTNETGWAGYVAGKAMLLGLWVANGEVNTNLGTVLLANVTDGFFVGLDITRDGGPNTAQTFFNLTNVSNFHVSDCNFVGGPSGEIARNIAFNFVSTSNSSSNIVQGCHFEDMATVIPINGSNGTVGLTTYGLHLGNVPLATAIIDQSPQASGIPAAIGNTKDQVWTGPFGNTLFRVNNVASSVNFLRHQPATTSNPPTLCFDGSEGQVNGTIQTKGGNLFIKAAGGTSGSGNLLSLMNTAESTNWIALQKATSENLSFLSTNRGGLGINPQGALWLFPVDGMFIPGLPTTKPAIGSSQIWNNNGALSIA